MNNENVRIIYEELMKETMHSTHGYWRRDNFKDWGKRSLRFIDIACGLNSGFYVQFFRLHHEAVNFGSSDEKFPTYVSLCISILKSVFQEYECTENK